MISNNNNIVGLTPQKATDLKSVEEVTPKPRGLEDLDILGEALIKQSLPSTARHQSSFQKPVDRVPLNELARKRAQSEIQPSKENLLVNSLPRTSFIRLLKNSCLLKNFVF